MYTGQTLKIEVLSKYVSHQTLYMYIRDLVMRKYVDRK